MGVGRALLVGVSKPSERSGWSADWLPGVLNDVRAMNALLSGLHFTVGGLVEQAATAEATLGAIRAAASQLNPGDMFVFCYSGHGAGIRNQQDPDEWEDQLLLTYDRPILDDELGRLWPLFKKDVRIVVITDSCHSGSVVRGLDRGTTPADLRDIRIESDRTAGPRFLSIGLEPATDRSTRTRDGNIAGLQGSLIHMAACLDAQKAIDLGSNGAFTSALLAAWNAGFTASYDQLFGEIVQRVRTGQTPRMTVYGWDQRLFREQKPFDYAARWPV